MTITDTPVTILPLAVPDALATAEAVDVTLIGDAMETVDVGPFNGVYFRVAADDLVVAVDQARRVLDELEAAVLDARQDRMEAQRHECPGCPTRLDPDEVTCGAAYCNRIYAQDCAGLIP